MKINDQNRDEKWKIERWNIKGLNGKQKKLEDEFEEMCLDILGTKRTKGDKGTK